MPSILFAMLGCVPVLTTPGGPVADQPWMMPVNSWPVSTPPDGLRAEGFDPGEVIPDFRLPDQHWDEVSLWQFWGRVVVVDVSTMWCSPCQQLARGIPEIAESWRDEGLIYLTVFPQDVHNEIPDQADLEEWAESFDIEEPLLSDAEGWSYDVVPDNAFPGVLIVGEDMRVVSRVGAPTDAAVEAAIEAAYE
jgi:thiol-disulfide isomerase/thioredoxin